MEQSSQSGAPSVDAVQPLCSPDPTTPDTLLVGARFSSAQSFKHALRTEAIKTNFGIKMTKSDSTRVLAACSYTGCPWKIRATLCTDGYTFEVRKLGAAHTCPGINRAGNKQATADWVAGEIAEMVKLRPSVPPKEIRTKLETSYGLSLPYMKLWRSREMARDSLFGSVDNNYRYVPALQAELVRRNPGSHITYMVDAPNNSFKRFFVSFKVCVEGFLMGCRPLIGLDACHLKSKYLGVLLSANSLDGNNGLYTIAFAVVEGESKSSWTWFLENLLVSFRFEIYPLALISDMEKGLLEAARTVFPNAEHRVCIRHLWKNIKKHFKCQEGHKLHGLVWSAANTYKQSDYQAKLNEIYTLSTEMYTYLTSLPYMWSRSQFSVEIKNDSNTNNMAESFNSWVTEARNQPVVDLIYTIRGMLMSQRANRHITSLSWQSELVPLADEYIRDVTTRREHFILRVSNLFRCEIESIKGIFEVDLQTSECSCRFWQVTGLPCIHAVAFIATKPQPSWHTYIDAHYAVERYKMAYSGAISTMPGKEQWEVIEGDNVITPDTSRPRGRPRTKRFKSFLETEKGNSSKSTHRCGRCLQWGHHKNTCKNPLFSTESQASKGRRDKLAVLREFTYDDAQYYNSDN